MRLQGKVAVVTGAATGIGQPIAFSAEGAAVAIDYVGQGALAEETVKRIEAAHLRRSRCLRSRLRCRIS
jgi:NAD(P)-dependent dehydrogenase (short-subunit alcohol dehydrogenase family)